MAPGLIPCGRAGIKVHHKPSQQLQSHFMLFLVSFCIFRSDSRHLFFLRKMRKIPEYIKRKDSYLFPPDPCLKKRTRGPGPDPCNGDGRESHTEQVPSATGLSLIPHYLFGLVFNSFAFSLSRTFILRENGTNNGENQENPLPIGCILSLANDPIFDPKSIAYLIWNHILTSVASYLSAHSSHFRSQQILKFCTTGGVRNQDWARCLS